MTASLKMSQLRKKISDLESNYQTLLQERANEISNLICHVALSDIDNKMLIGGLLFIKQKIMNNDQIKEDWQNAGGRFLRSKTHQIRSERKKQNHTSPSPKTTPQSNKKSSPTREVENEKAI